MVLTQDQLNKIHRLHRLVKAVNQVIIGKEDITTLTITAMLAGGHVLFEDIPGVGKTLLVKTIAKGMGADFSRIQFTPDLVPSDIIGFSMPQQGSDSFVFRKGPLFASIVLADEINRTSPRTQAAMLEAMAERQVTMDGKTYALPDPFFVLATQNPLEYEGTYPLPEAQLDRFLMQLSLGYPTQDEEIAMLAAPDQNETVRLMEPVLDIPTFRELKELVPSIHAEETILRYVVDLGLETRQHAGIRLGISPRGNQYCLLAARAYALINGHDFVTPDDIQAVVPAIYRHRLLFRENLDIREKDDAIQRILERVRPPLRRRT